MLNTFIARRCAKNSTRIHRSCCSALSIELPIELPRKCLNSCAQVHNRKSEINKGNFIFVSSSIHRFNRRALFKTNSRLDVPQSACNRFAIDVFVYKVQSNSVRHFRVPIYVSSVVLVCSSVFGLSLSLSSLIVATLNNFSHK